MSDQQQLVDALFEGVGVKEIGPGRRGIGPGNRRLRVQAMWRYVGRPITAASVAAGCSRAEVNDIIFNLDFKSMDTDWLGVPFVGAALHVLYDVGLYKGQFFDAPSV